MSDDGVMKMVQHIIAEIKVGGNPLWGKMHSRR